MQIAFLYAMKRFYIVLLLCCAGYSTAQSTAVETRDSNSPMLAYALRPVPPAPLALRPNFLVQNTPNEVKVHRFNRTFVFLATVSAAATIADIELTANCLKTVGNCRESNPLLGSDPSRARLYSVNVPIYASQMMLSRMLQRRFPQRKLWMVPFLSSTGTHAVGAASNLWARP
jgi:hypothetical protein